MKVHLKCPERVSYVSEPEVKGNLMKNESLTTSIFWFVQNEVHVGII